MNTPATVRAAATRALRTYRVDIVSRADGKTVTRLVKAPTDRGAAAHVSSDLITARLATQDDLIELLPTVKVETAGDAPAPADPDPAGKAPGEP